MSITSQIDNMLESIDDFQRRQRSGKFGENRLADICNYLHKMDSIRKLVPALSFRGYFFGDITTTSANKLSFKLGDEFTYSLKRHIKPQQRMYSEEVFIVLQGDSDWVVDTLQMLDIQYKVFNSRRDMRILIPTDAIIALLDYFEMYECLI